MDRRSFLKSALTAGTFSAAGVWLVSPWLRPPAAKGDPLRPPGALEEPDFLSRCIRCLRCADACPNRAVLLLDNSFGRHRALTPAIQARRQACMLCNGTEGKYLRCTEVCPSGALQKVRREPEEIQTKVRMGTAEIDRALCYSYNHWTCGACYRACPFAGRAMTLGLWERPEVHPASCVGCGLCERSCIRYPQAIRVKARGLR
jgi:ferredoxin-type protein NapG